jgi:hypothetical protein
MKNSFLVVIVGATLAGCGGADTSNHLAASEQSSALVMGATVCDIETDSDALQVAYKTYAGNLLVPAGKTCLLYHSTVKGNVIVNGNLKAWGATFEKNVNVDGGSLKVFNSGATFLGNVSITNSAGPDGDGSDNGFWGDTNSTVAGNLIYENNTVPLFIGGVTVKGNFNYSGSPCRVFSRDGGDPSVAGQTSVSCY